MVCSFLSKLLGRSPDKMAYTIKKTTNLAYGALAHQRLDSFVPVTSAAKKPGMVLVAGGSFQKIDRTQQNEMCKRIAGELGYIAVTITYAVPGKGGYANQTLADILAAVAWLKAQTNIDPDRVGVWGSSAGALIAAHAAMAGGPAKLFIGEAGPYDIDPPSSQLTVTWLNGMTGYAASPIFKVTPQAKPAFLSHGKNDGTVPSWQSANMAETYRLAGVPYVLHYHSTGHPAPSKTAEKTALWKAQKAFIQARL